MSLVSVQQLLDPCARAANVTLPVQFYNAGPAKMKTLLGNQPDKFASFSKALRILSEDDRGFKDWKEAMMGRLRDHMVEDTHYRKPPGSSLRTGHGIILLVPGKNAFISAGVDDGDAWQPLHMGFRDWMLSNHLQILDAFTNPAPDLNYLNNRTNNVAQFKQNVVNIAQDNPERVAQRGERELLKSLVHTDELNITRDQNGSIKSAGLAVGGQTKRIILAVGGDPDDPATVRKVAKKGSISSQLTAPAQAMQMSLRAMADVSNAMNPGGYVAACGRVRDQFIDSGALLHKDANNNVFPAEMQRLLSFNPSFLASGGARRNGLELLGPAPAPGFALAAPALAAPALAPPALAAPALAA